MKRFLPLIYLISIIACDITITGPTIDNTNTNTNTNNIDIHDIGTSFPPSGTPIPPGNGGTVTPVNIPTTAQAIAEKYAANNPLLLTRSCQLTYGESAWLFMDGLVVTLKATDVRWGYLTKTDGTTSRDVIAYKGTNGNVGAWGVDVIIDLCGTPKFGWNVIGYDAAATWSEVRVK